MEIVSRIIHSRDPYVILSAEKFAAFINQV